MVFEEILLVLQSCSDGSLLVDVALSSVDDRDITETEGDDATGEDVDDIRALIPVIQRASEAQLARGHADVHEIDLCQHTDSSCSLRVDFASHLETIRVGQISVGGGDGQDDRVGLHDELQEHLADLSLNIARLIADRNLCRGVRMGWRCLGADETDLGQTGQINQSQGQDMRREDAKTNRQR